MQDFPPPPQIPPATSVEQALAFLAGEVWAAIDLEIETHGDEEVSESMFIIFMSLDRWRRSGFLLEEAEQEKLDVLYTRERARKLRGLITNEAKNCL